MDNILLVFFCLILGIGLKRTGAFPESAPVALNQFVIYVSLPALALIYIPRIVITLEVLYPVMVSWIVIGLALLVIPLIGKAMNWSRETIGCLLLTAGLGNTSFVGFPVIEALYGTEALQYALLVDQPGSFVALCTVGIIIASVYSSGSVTGRDIFRRIILFPPFISFMFAIILNIVDVQIGGSLLYILERLGATITPLALTSVGMQLSLNAAGVRKSAVVYGLGYKLILAPIVVFSIYVLMFGGSGDIVKVSIMEAAMAPMITGSIVAIMYGLNARLATLMVGVGVPLSFITLAGWYLFLEWFM